MGLGDIIEFTLVWYTCGAVFYLWVASISLQHYAVKYDVSTSQLKAFLDDLRFPLSLVRHFHTRKSGAKVLLENLDKVKTQEVSYNFSRLGVSFPIWFSMLVFAGLLIHYPFDLVVGIDIGIIEGVISVPFVICWRFGHNLPRYSGR